MDILTKIAHFILIVESISAEKLADLYIREVVVRHGLSVYVVLDSDVRLTSRFWRKFLEELGTQLHFNKSYYPHVDGHSKQMI